MYQYTANPSGWIDPLGLASCPCKTANKIREKASQGKVTYGKDYHGRLPKNVEQDILSSPDGIYQAKNGSLIFHKGEDVVITHGGGSAQGNVITSYGTSGPRGSSGASIFGGSPTDPGLPVTSDMILKGKIPKPDGTFIPPAIKI